MAITKKDVKHVAKLAKLKLTPKEIDKYTTQLSKVIKNISKLQEVKTDDVSQTSRTLDLKNVTSEDVIDVEEVLSADEATSNSSNIHNNYFVTKAVIDKES